MTWLSQSQAADLLGVSRRSLHRKDAELEALGLARMHGRRRVYAGVGLLEAFAEMQELQPANAHRSQPQPQGAEAAEKPASYGESRAKREAANAAIAELQLQKLQGSLVEVTEVTNMLFVEFRRARDALMGLPVRLAPELAGRDSASMIQTLQRSFHQLLTDLGDGCERVTGGNSGLEG